MPFQGDIIEKLKVQEKVTKFAEFSNQSVQVSRVVPKNVRM
jgi:hypothetical protein